MNEEQYRILMNRALVYARSVSNELYTAARQMRYGKICRSCKSPLPLPHTQGAKRCAFCADKHLVYMYFRYCSDWHCGFRTETRKKLPREVTFGNAASVREMVRRGNGLIDNWDQQGFELGLEIGKGGVWLRLSDDQFRALGGVL
jgi:LSD1 subclass zinc finger protein